MDGDSGYIAASDFALTEMDSGTDLKPKPFHTIADRDGATNSARRRLKRRQKPVSGRLHLPRAERQRSDRQRSRRRQHAPRHIADVQVAAVHRRARLAHLRIQHHADGLGVRPHGERDANIANQPLDRTREA